MDWQHLLAYITGTVDQELLLRNEYLVRQNHVLRSQITGRVRLTDDERKTLAEIGQKLSKQALAGRVPGTAHALWGKGAATRPDGIYKPLSSREKSSRQGQRTALAFCAPGHRTRRPDAGS